ncbi:hypothetical protein [Chitinilyticum aquatile]|uniref:hypothetical protein n=1 Tax=Chitinilyticum aquatile TaxID=362520 RepID=UPI000420DA3E|nr:hypothetical protein [Chitinilyticum aquatile]
MKALKSIIQKLTASDVTVDSRGYVQTYRIDGINDVFDGSQIWKSPIAFSLHTHLEDLLSAHGYRERDKHVFTHVELELPAIEVEHDRRVSRGQRSESLCEALVAMLQDSFAKHVPMGASVRFSVRPGQDLPAQSVRVRFGHTIYVPAAEDVAVWKVECSTDGVIWTHVSEIQQEQRLMLLGGNAEYASAVAADWPFAAHVGIMMNHAPDKALLDITAEPCGSLKITRDDALGYYLIESGPLRYFLRTTRLIPFVQPKSKSIVQDPVAQDSPAIEGEKQTPAAQTARPIILRAGRKEPVIAGEKVAASISADRTYMPQSAPPQPDDMKTYVFTGKITQSSALTLVGIALQKVSAFGEANIRGLGFGFDSAAQIAPVYGKAATAVLSIHVDESDQLRVATPAGCRPLNLGEQLPLQGTSGIRLDAVPAPLQDRHLAFCLIPRPVIGRIGGEVTHSFGRHHPALKHLRVMAGAGFLDHETQEDGDRMGISRDAFDYQLTADGLKLTLRPNQQLAHLDGDLQFVATLSHAEDAAPALIPAGHHLVVGHYLLRYDA